MVQAVFGGSGELQGLKKMGATERVGAPALGAGCALHKQRRHTELNEKASCDAQERMGWTLVPGQDVWSRCMPRPQPSVPGSKPEARSWLARMAVRKRAQQLGAHAETWPPGSSLQCSLLGRAAWYGTLRATCGGRVGAGL